MQSATCDKTKLTEITKSIIYQRVPVSLKYFCLGDVGSGLFFFSLELHRCVIIILTLHILLLLMIIIIMIIIIIADNHK